MSLTDQPPDTRFSAELDEELAGYRRVSWLAVSALVLACLSALSFVSPLLWPLPLAALLTAASALRVVERSGGDLSGRGAAAAALVLALFFAGFAPARHVARQQMLYRQARDYADQWLQLVLAGRIEEAHQLHLSKGERQPAHISLRKYYAPQPPPPHKPGEPPPPITAYEKLTSFFASEPLKTIVAHRKTGRPEFVRNMEQQEQDGVRRVVLEYVFHYDENGGRKSLPFCLCLFSYLDPNKREAYWEVQDVFDPSEADAARPPGY